MVRKKSSLHSSPHHYPPKHLAPLAKDPWDMEHKKLLGTRGPTACTDLAYPFVKHAGFSADYTAKELRRRYSAFEEAEQHRETLVKSLSERLQVPGEQYDYFTPEQLWGEDDRLQGVRQFTKDDDVSWDEEASTSEDDIAAKCSHHCAITNRQELGGDLQLPIKLQAGDHKTIITQNHQEIHQTLGKLELSRNPPLTAIASTFMNGTLAIALLGHAKGNNTGDSKKRAKPAWLNKGIPSTFAEQESPATDAGASEWSLLMKRPGRPNATFLFGAKTWATLLSAIRWENDDILAVIQQYSNSHIFMILVGTQAFHGPTSSSVPRAPADHSSMLETFLDANVISYLREISPKSHVGLISLLQSAQRDLAEADLIDVATDESGCSSPTTVLTQERDMHSEIVELPNANADNMTETAQRALESSTAADLPKPSVSLSRHRMLQILQHPKVERHNSLQPLAMQKQDRRKHNVVSKDKDDDDLQLLTPPPTNAHKTTKTLQATANTSGFPDGFGSSRGKLIRQINSEDGSEGDSEPSPSKPRKKQKQKQNSTLHTIHQASATATLESSYGKDKKKRARKPMTAAESRKSIADIKAQLKLFKEARRKSTLSESGASGIVDSAAVGVTAMVLQGNEGKDVDMGDEQLSFIPEESEEEGEEI